MNRIRLLDSVTVNQIAAGEVVERPLSVVKELTENSIDAGASAITVEIKDGGITYIRVTDNGCGIPKEDVRTAFLQHATSKVTGPDDLTRIGTLGFRGEALSSVAAVSQAEMITKTASDVTGLCVQLSGGALISEREIGCADGASVIVRNLFSNTPARLKFLKKPGSEGALVSDFINRLVLCRPDITFKYINNGTIALSTNGNGDLKAAILRVYGRDYANRLIEVNERGNDMCLSGYIAKPEISRSNRAHQNFFINGRYVKSELARIAVEEGFAGKMMTGRFPVFVMNLRIRLEMVDVNVHPNKLDVRFREDEAVYNLIRGATAKALDGSIIIPAVTAGSEKQGAEQVRTPFPAIKPLKSKLKEVYEGCSDHAESPESYLAAESDSNSSIVPRISEFDEPPASKPFLPQYRIIGQFFQVYWIVESGESVYIIDQHAAHERILFEDIKKRLQSKERMSQRLILPIALNLTPSERQILDDNRGLIESFGFELEDLGGSNIALRSVPVLLKDPESAGFFIEILNKLNNIDPSETNIYDLKLDTIAQTACKAAVKARDRLSFPEAKALIDRMLALPNPFTCPHGRPTTVEMTKHEWDRKFKRT
ncbi:MAG: DNA mismatch repair endonuclease MutL [Clostridiales bacterium]|jgi:DNA mismatch repair protein MutL|nr:DNA mismatch repair endonuclease MutL [Clostridiales bacterium]